MFGHAVRRTVGNAAGSSGHWTVEDRDSADYIATCTTVGASDVVYIGILDGSTTGIAEIDSDGLPLVVNTYNLAGDPGTIINALAASSTGVVAGGALLPSSNTKTESLYGAIDGDDLDYRTISQDPSRDFEVNAVASISGVQACIVGRRGTLDAFIAIEETGETTVQKRPPTATNLRSVAADGTYLYFGLDLVSNFVGLGRGTHDLSTYVHNGFGMGGLNHRVPELTADGGNSIGF